MDPTIVDCPQLISKWQAKIVGNPDPPPNLNQNVQKNFAKPREPTIDVLTRVVAASGDDQGEPCPGTRI